MCGTEITPPIFSALDREADMALDIQEVLNQNPGAAIRYGDTNLIDDLCETLTDWEDFLSPEQDAGEPDISNC